MAEIVPIAHIKTDFPSKFGVPRQSGIVNELHGCIVFEKEYSFPEAVRGLEEYSHIWLLWQFSKNGSEWSPTVRPPKLGGNKRVGVFASRSPFRPNSIGLSCVKLEKIEINSNNCIVLHVSGADLVDGTPIYDIKPYLPYTDCHPDADGGFSLDGNEAEIEVIFPEPLLTKVSSDLRNALISVLSQDPHPAYKNDPERIYHMPFADYEISFTVNDKKLTVCSVERIK